nr:DUF3108 domain-containing protein [Simplicispira psychrophila]
MPRLTRWRLTALVLALHWLVLVGLPLQQHAPLTPPAQVFSTRTLAAPAPAPSPPPSSAAAAVPKSAPVRRTPVRKQPPAPVTPQALPAPDTTPQPASAVAAMAPSEASAENASTPPAEAETPGAAAAPEGAGAQAAATDPNPTPNVPAGSTSAAPTEPVLPTSLAPTGAIDIEVPGAVARSGPGTTPAVQIPAPRRLQFDVSGEAKKFHYSARAELLWQHDGQHYQARQEISLLFLGARTQTSVGALSDGGLRPQRFGDRARNEQAAHFDYAQGQVTFSANTPPAAMVVGTQDRLSVFIQLGALLAAAPERYPPGTRISLATVGARAADVWAFTVQGTEMLDLPTGALSALKLQRLPRRDHEYDQKAELWLAPTLGYLPVRIRITQANGDFADLRLRSQAPP